MAQLHEVVGSILREVAKSRFSSDLYSRTISRYYERDSLLRRFPVPRTEIDEIELELKFLIDEMIHDPAAEEGRESTIAQALVNLSDALMVGFFHNLILSSTKLGYDRPPQHFFSSIHRINLRQFLIRYFQDNRHLLVSENGTFDVEAAFVHLEPHLLPKIKEIVLANPPDESQGVSDQLLEEIKKDIIDGMQLQQLIKSAGETIENVWNPKGDAKVSVEVEAGKLMETDPELLSMIKIKATVRNYAWDRVDHEGADSWYALNPTN